MANYIRFYERGTSDIFEIYLHDDERTITLTTGNERTHYQSEKHEFDSGDSTAEFLGEKVEEYRVKEWPTVGMVFRSEPIKFILTPEHVQFYQKVEAEFGCKYAFSSDAYLKLPVFLGSANLTYDKIQLFTHFKDYFKTNGWDFEKYIPLGSYVATNEQEIAVYQEANPSELEAFYSYCLSDKKVYRFHHDVGADEVGSLENFRQTLSASVD